MRMEKISKQPLNQQQDIKTGEQLILMKCKASSGGNAVKWNHKWVPINHPYHLPSSSQANTGWSSSFIQVEFNRLETFTFGDTSVRCVRGFWCSGLICYARTFIPICPISFMNRYYKKNPLGRHCRRGNC